MRNLATILIVLSLLVGVGSYAGTRYVDQALAQDVVLLTSVNDEGQQEVSRYTYDTVLEEAEDEGEEVPAERRRELIVSIYGSAASLETVRVVAPDSAALITASEDPSIKLYPQTQPDGTYAYQSKSLLYLGGQASMGAIAAFVILLALRFTVLRKKD